MKNICKLLFILLGTSTSAQITLDTVVTSQSGIGSSFYTVQISSNETKYLYEDSLTNTFSLYNMDFTPFLTSIPVPEPFDNWTFQVQYVSRSLFDCDSTNIEFVYEAPTTGYKSFYIMRTDGTELFKLDSANGPFCAGGCLSLSDVIRPIRNTSSGTKLFLQRPWSMNQAFTTNIYSLCGSLPLEVLDLTIREQTFVSVYPNPASMSLTFILNLPDNINEYELVIVDSNSKEIKREQVRIQNAEFKLDANNLSQGTYYYSLCTKNKSYQSGRFIITK